MKGEASVEESMQLEPPRPIVGLTTCNIETLGFGHVDCLLASGLKVPELTILCLFQGCSDRDVDALASKYRYLQPLRSSRPLSTRVGTSGPRGYREATFSSFDVSGAEPTVFPT